MKRNLLPRLGSIFVFVCLLHSCQKEISCESCNAAPSAGVNQAPVALAGRDTTITLPVDSLVLNGSSSHDPDGTIVQWKWRPLSGPSPVTIDGSASAVCTVRSLVQGVYRFELSVTDNGGAYARDTVQVTVNKPAAGANRPPVACAGPDQTLTWPATSISLDGSCSSDPDGNITSYYWSKISGPYAYMGPANTAKTRVDNTVQGTYMFELKVTDAGGLVSRDTVIVRVINGTQPPPGCTSCRIVFVSDRDGNEELYTCAADGTGIMRLTHDPADDREPKWSPSGAQIAFVSDRSGKFEVYTMNADGSNVVRKTFTGPCFDPVWSPDGSKIVYTTGSNGSFNLWVLNVNGGTPTLLFATPGYEGSPSWSPDGSRILFTSDFAAYDIQHDVYQVKADGSGLVNLTQGNIFDHTDYFTPAWSPDGKTIALVMIETLGANQTNIQIGIMNTDGSNRRPILQSAGANTGLAWSPDGSKIAFTLLNGTRTDVAWVSVDGMASGLIVANGWEADWR